MEMVGKSSTEGTEDFIDFGAVICAEEYCVTIFCASFFFDGGKLSVGEELSDRRFSFAVCV